MLMRLSLRLYLEETPGSLTANMALGIYLVLGECPEVHICQKLRGS